MENAKHTAESRPVAKRLVTAVTAIAACVALMAGGTLAYFSAEGTAHNVITSGDVKIQLNEWADKPQGEVPFENVDGVMPGTEVTKIVEVKNTGSADAWVRVKADVAIRYADGTPAWPTDVSQVVSIDFDKVNWTYCEEDGWYYYNCPLPADPTDENPGADITKPLFKHVTFDGPNMGNGYQDCTVTVDVYAQAVQYDNNADEEGKTALDAEGWPALQITGGSAQSVEA